MDRPVSLQQPQVIPSTDRLGRSLRELRLSVIDRCNFRCTYCMPLGSMKGRGSFLPLEKLLTDHEIVDLVTAFAGLGVHKLRITGGEPLIRPGLPALVERLVGIPGLDDIALTTNGVMLPRLADDLAEAGLGRITVSLDTLDPEILDASSGGKARIQDVLAGIEAAENAGFESIKINTVVQKGVNDHTVLDLLAHFRGSNHPVRLIEYMDVGSSNGWEMGHVVTAEAILATINEAWPLDPVEPNYPGEVVNRWRYRDGGGEIGVIASVTNPFCGECTRLRLSADGSIYTCLFAAAGTDLRDPLRSGATDEELVEIVAGVWAGRTDKYSEERSGVSIGLPKVEMSYIGG